jgi:hypothetical protein
LDAPGASAIVASKEYQVFVTSLKERYPNAFNNIEANSVIVLIRNGMLIARHDKMLANEINSLRKNEDFEPFSVVINRLRSIVMVNFYY